MGACVPLYEEETSLSCLICCFVCRRGCVNAHMHVIVCECLWLCTTLSFYMGMCRSLCWEVHKYILKTAWVFLCVCVHQGRVCVSKISVYLCFLSVRGNVCLSPADATLLQSRSHCHFGSSVDRWDSTDCSLPLSDTNTHTPHTLTNTYTHIIQNSTELNLPLLFGVFKCDIWQLF